MSQENALAPIQELAGTIFSVGHSGHSLDHFLLLLSQHKIEVLVDTRTYPVSRHCPHFNSENLQPALAMSGIKYVYMGKELGGRPSGDHFYDAEGRVLYWRVAESALFQAGLQRLKNGATQYRLALMCAEEDPLNCHRRLLVGRVLTSYGYQLLHIRGSGHTESEEAIGKRGRGRVVQLDMFLRKDDSELWKSTRSVLQKGQQRSSLVPSKKPR